MHPDKTRKKVTNACGTKVRSARITSEPMLSKPIRMCPQPWVVIVVLSFSSRCLVELVQAFVSRLHSIRWHAKWGRWREKKVYIICPYRNDRPVSVPGVTRKSSRHRHIKARIYWFCHNSKDLLLCNTFFVRKEARFIVSVITFLACHSQKRQCNVKIEWCDCEITSLCQNTNIFWLMF